MTAQIEDRFVHEATTYLISRIDGGEPFDPAAHGLTPFPPHTACHRGFYCTYTTEDERLVLKDLFIGLPPSVAPIPARKLPKLFGRLPTYSDGGAFHLYADLGAPLDFSGTLWAGDDFINDLYVHMGIQAPHTYRTMLLFEFERGVLAGVEDCSAEMALERMDHGYRPSREERAMLYGDRNDGHDGHAGKGRAKGNG